MAEWVKTTDERARVKLSTRRLARNKRSLRTVSSSAPHSGVLRRKASISACNVAARWSLTAAIAEDRKWETSSASGGACHVNAKRGGLSGSG